ncbi:regulating synaptic membrane exocytosis protein 2-like [Mytilus edulis]|uniref:regulating synaptic membrane exocytosis protein 2-like n=1 Tax=Mytilus edulis TaxID=6550 RepID=UPI0039EE5F46
MANIFKKAFKGRHLNPNNNECKRSRSPQPPPSPDLTGLSSVELAALNDVIKRQEEFENKEKNRIEQIKEQLRVYECQVKRQSSTKGKLKHIDLRLCRLCYKTKFADGIGRVCYDCRKRVCQRCGSYVRDPYNHKSSKRGRGRWQCNMCLLKRELLCKTGEWYHGHKAQPSLNKQAFTEKLDSIDVDSSDIEEFSRKQTCSSVSESASETATDTEVLCNRTNHKNVSQQIPRRRSMFASTTIEVSEFESDNGEHYERRPRRSSRRHTSRSDVKKKRHKMQWQDNSDSNSENQTDEEMDYISNNHLNVPREIKNSRRRKGSEKRKQYSSSDKNNANLNRVKDKCLHNYKGKASANSKNLTLSINDIDEKCRRSSNESVHSSKNGGVCVFFHPYDSLSEGQISKSTTSSSQIHRQDAVCFSSSSSILSENMLTNRIRRQSLSPAPSPSNSRKYKSETRRQSLSPAPSPLNNRQYKSETPRQRSRASSADYLEYDNNSEQKHQLQVDAAESNSRRCSDESIRSRRSTQSDASQYYRDYFNNLKPREVLLYRDSVPYSPRHHGLGMRVIGGKRGPDGGLGAYVTYVEKKGPADSYDIVEGDQILFWNGKSLIDVSFEESRDIMSQSTDFVQLLVVHFPERKEDDFYRRNRTVAKPIWAIESNGNNPLVDIPVVVSSQMAKSNSPVLEPPKTLPLQKPKRRMLPKTPLEIKKEDRPVTGKLLFSLGYNEEDECLSVNLVSAETLKPPDRLSVADMNPIAMVHILPDRSLFPPYETIPQFNVNSPIWEETFNLLDLSKSELEEKSLEVTIWNYLGHEYEFLGEVLLDLADSKLDNEVVTYDLQDHDENSSPLPVRRRRESGSDINAGSFVSPVDTSSMTSSPCNFGSPSQSRDMLHHTDGKSDSKKTPKRKSSPGLEKLHRVYQSVPSSPTISPDTNKDVGFYEQLTHRGSISSKMRRRVSSAMAKISSFSHPERRNSRETEKEALANRSKSAGDVIFQITNTPSPRHSIQNTIASCATSLSSFYDNDSDGEDDKHLSKSDRLLSVDRPPPEGDDITSSLGSSQIPPKPSSEQSVCGNIRLGFMVSKGQLEIDVIHVSGLQNGNESPPPDTYVKTYLVEGLKTIQKKKTQVIKASFEPMFRKKIKYSACNIHGRSIKIIVWARQKTFDKKLSLGEAIIKLDGLNLSEHTVSWYKLFQTGAADYGSNESLSFW